MRAEDSVFASEWSARVREKSIPADSVPAEVTIGLGRPNATIGRSSKCDAQLEHASCSGTHLKLAFNTADESLTATDVSSNGTWIGRVRKTRGTPFNLSDGETIALIENRGNLVAIDISRRIIPSQLRIVPAGDSTRSTPQIEAAKDGVFDIRAAQSRWNDDHAELVREFESATTLL